MESNIIKIKHKERWIFSSITLGAFVLHQISIFCGLNQTFDSHLYLRMANSINQSGLLAAIYTDGFNAKPPLYPLLISLISVEGMKYFNGVCFLITLCFSLLIINKLFSDFVVKVLCFISLSLGIPLLLVHSFLWTEPVFITLFVIHLYLIYNYYISRGKAGLLLILIVASILMALVRHAGIFIILGTIISLFVTGKSRKDYLSAGLYGFFASSIFIAWNFIKSKGFDKRYNDLLVPMTKDKFSIYKENIISYLDQLPQWLIPPVFPFDLDVFIFIIFSIVISFIFWKSILTNSEKRFLSSIAIVFVVYYGCMHTMYTVNPADVERYLSPVFPVFTIILFKAVELSVPLLRNVLQLKYIYIVFTLVLLAYPALRAIKNVWFFYQSSCNP